MAGERKDQSWLGTLSEEELAKLLLIELEIFKKYGIASSTGLSGLVGAGNRLAIRRIIQPVVKLDPIGQIVPVGMCSYKTAGNVWTLLSERSTTGEFKIAHWYAGSELSPYAIMQSHSPYASDGSALLPGTSSPNATQSVSIQVNIAADGSVALTQLLAAHATKKYILYDVHVSFGSSAITANERPVVLNLTISDSCGFVGTNAPMLGPKKQGTAATAISVSAIAGDCSPTAAGGKATVTARFKVEP